MFSMLFETLFLSMIVKFGLWFSMPTPAPLTAVLLTFLFDMCLTFKFYNYFALLRNSKDLLTGPLTELLESLRLSFMLPICV